MARRCGRGRVCEHPSRGSRREFRWRETPATRPRTGHPNPRWTQGLGICFMEVPNPAVPGRRCAGNKRVPQGDASPGFTALRAVEGGSPSLRGNQLERRSERGHPALELAVGIRVGLVGLEVVPWKFPPQPAGVPTRREHSRARTEGSLRPRSRGITSNQGRSEGVPPSNWPLEPVLDSTTWKIVPCEGCSLALLFSCEACSLALLFSCEGCPLALLFSCEGRPLALPG